MWDLKSTRWKKHEYLTGEYEWLILYGIAKNESFLLETDNMDETGFICILETNE